MIYPPAAPQRIVAAIPEQPLGNHVTTPRASRPSGASPGGDAGTGRTGHQPRRLTLEKGTRQAVRGWLLDEADPNRRCRRHGFLWRIPASVAGPDGTRIDVFDADPGQPLSGSPVRLESGQVVAGAGGGP